jgi:hypothetical protein
MSCSPAAAHGRIAPPVGRSSTQRPQVHSAHETLVRALGDALAAAWTEFALVLAGGFASEQLHAGLLSNARTHTVAAGGAEVHAQKTPFGGRANPADVCARRAVADAVRTPHAAAEDNDRLDGAAREFDALVRLGELHRGHARGASADGAVRALRRVAPTPAA